MTDYHTTRALRLIDTIEHLMPIRHIVPRTFRARCKDLFDIYKPNTNEHIDQYVSYIREQVLPALWRDKTAK